MNNNVALVQNELQQELIVGWEWDCIWEEEKWSKWLDDKVEKVFRLNTDESRENLWSL